MESKKSLIEILTKKEEPSELEKILIALPPAKPKQPDNPYKKPKVEYDKNPYKK